MNEKYFGIIYLRKKSFSNDGQAPRSQQTKIVLGQTDLKPPNYRNRPGTWMHAIYPTLVDLGPAYALFSGRLTFGPGFHPGPRHTQPLEDPIFDSCQSKWSLVQWLPLNSTTLPFYFGTLTGLGITYLIDETKLVPILWLNSRIDSLWAIYPSLNQLPAKMSGLGSAARKQ